MKHSQLLVIVLILSVLQAGCNTTANIKRLVLPDCLVVPTAKEQQKLYSEFSAQAEIWKYSDEAVQIQLIASDSLNQYNGLSHAAVVGLYQLSSPDEFVKEISTRTGLSRILGSETNLPESILQYDIKSIQPRSILKLDISRIAGAKFIAIVVGYSDLITNQIVRIIQIPLVSQKRSAFNPLNWVLDAPDPFPAKINVVVKLGSYSIEQSLVTVPESCNLT